MATSISPSDQMGPSNFRNNCRMILKLLQERDKSVAFSPEAPGTPVTRLAFGFSHLNTGEGDTPKRCLDLSNLSTDEVGFLRAVESPMTPVGQPKTPAWDPLCDPLKSDNGGGSRALPLLFFSTPRTNEPVRGSKAIENKENEGSWLKPAGRRAPLCLQLQKETTPPGTAQRLNVLASKDCEIEELGSPIAQVVDGLDMLCRQTGPNTDGFSEFFTEEEQMEDSAAPVSSLSSSMAALLSGPLLNQDIDVNNVSLNRSRLYRSPSMPEQLDRPVRKRSVQPLDDETPVKVKRSRSTTSPTEGVPGPGRRRGTVLKKTLSLCDVDKDLDEDYGHRQLIGDLSKVYALPIVTGRHQDLRYITTETMAALLHGEFSSLVEKCFIIDCRYPYEYSGGHIQGAVNIHRQQDLLDWFLKEPLVPSIEGKRIILLFHCEFSSERGPKMCRFLREEDRDRNEYPSLHYPELYILKGGYREFFSDYKELCDPQSYCPMHHQDFREEMLQFRTKSKSWAGERRLKEQVARLVNK
ncbi:M-phase inducer phosphatase 3 isoform X2 [Ambystoma mexicanum]